MIFENESIVMTIASVTGLNGLESQICIIILEQRSYC